jgi:hypothetical protein
MILIAFKNLAQTIRKYQRKERKTLLTITILLTMKFLWETNRNFFKKFCLKEIYQCLEHPS